MLLVQTLLAGTVMWHSLCCHATTGDELATQDVRDRLTHGDPCGSAANTTLVCCPGAGQSTLIYQHEECCNGRPVGQGELCCDWAVPVPRASPTHDACCLDVRTGRGLTFDSHLSFCERDTWQIRDRPFVGDWPPSSFLRKMMPSSLPSSSSSSSVSSSLVRSQTRLCRAGPDENRSLRPIDGREEPQCCSLISYYASQKTCCAGSLFDMPTADARCCGGHAYSKNDPSNPCLSVCGDNQVFDRETELCCQGVVRPAASGNEICCGTDVISRRSHRCCRDRTPFTKHYMQCNRQGKLERKRTGVFTTRKLCRGRLPTWADGWPQPALTDNLLHIQGQVVNVMVNTSGQPHVQLTVCPFRMIDSVYDEHDSLCTEQIHVKALLEAETVGNCHAETQLRDYFRGKTLILFSVPTSLEVSTSNVTTVTVPSSSSVHLMLVSFSQD